MTRRTKRWARQGLLAVLLGVMALAAPITAKAETLAMTPLKAWRFVYRTKAGADKATYATRLSLDGREVFCVQPEVLSHNGDVYSEPIPAEEIYDEATLETLSQIVHFGFVKSPRSDLTAVFTKLMVYEALGYPVKDLKDMSGEGVFTDEAYAAYKTKTMRAREAHTRKPSFHEATTTLSPGETITLNDTNKVLHTYTVAETPPGVAATRQGHTLVLKASAEAKAGRVTLRNAVPEDVGARLLYRHATGQDVIALKLKAPVQAYLNVALAPTGGFRLVKTNEKGHPIGGARFRLDGQGKALTLDVGPEGLEVKDLPLGTYTLTELSAPEGYTKANERQTITITDKDSPKNRVVSVINQRDKARLWLKKVNAKGEALPGVTFDIAATSDFQDKKRLTTDAKGEIQMAVACEAPDATWYVQEVSVPPPYQKSDAIVRVTLRPGHVTTLTLTNDLSPGRVKVKKRDAKTTAPLKGAVITLVSPSGTVVRATTDAKGEATFDRLRPGRYTVRETTAPPGYVLDQAAHDVTVESGETAEVALVNTKAPVRLVLRKRDGATNRPLPGATFRLLNDQGEALRLSDESDPTCLTTNADGVARSHAVLRPGVYRLIEVRPPDGYAPHQPMTVTIDDDSDLTTLDLGERALVKTITNDPTEVRLSKVDPSGRRVAGAHLTVIDAKGREVARFVSTETAKVISGLSWGATYTLRETKAPRGYELAKPVTFTVSAPVTEVRMINRPTSLPDTGEARSPSILAALLVTSGLAFALIRRLRRTRVHR